MVNRTPEHTIQDSLSKLRVPLPAAKTTEVLAELAAEGWEFTEIEPTTLPQRMRALAGVLIEVDERLGYRVTCAYSTPRVIELANQFTEEDVAAEEAKLRDKQREDSIYWIAQSLYALENPGKPWERNSAAADNAQGWARGLMDHYDSRHHT